MASQLRIYDIKPGGMGEFAAKVRELVMPLRRDHGFTIEGPWVVAEANQYVWVVQYAGEGTFEAAVERYYEDPRRADIDFDPGEYIVGSDLRMMDSI